MAVDLFSKYYTNPDHQYLQTNLICSGASDGTSSFSISGDAATITDSNGNTLAKLDLSDLGESLTEYTTDKRIIEAYDFAYFKGFNQGKAYERIVFFGAPDELFDQDDYLYVTNIEFEIVYYSHGLAKHCTIEAKGDDENDQTFIEAAQEALDNNEIPVNITADGNLVVFTAANTGYEFHIGCCEHPNAIVMSGTFIDETTKKEMKITTLLYDYEPAYIPPCKYRNGAFKGVIIKPTYPEYNADSISDTQRALKLAFLPNRLSIEFPVKVCDKVLYDKYQFDVLGDYTDMFEVQRFEQWRDIDNSRLCTASDTYYEQIKDRNVIGLYGFVDWMYEYNDQGWLNVGSLFADIAPADPADTSDMNLVPSFVIYNPNPFPVQVSTLLFS